MLLLGKPVIEECKKKHAHLRTKLDGFTAAVEQAVWKTPVDMKSTLQSADPVGDFYAIDVGGKKGARVIIVVQFAKQTVIIHKVFTVHSEYEKWSNKTQAEHDRQRKQGRKGK